MLLSPPRQHSANDGLGRCGLPTRFAAVSMRSLLVAFGATATSSFPIENDWDMGVMPDQSPEPPPLACGQKAWVRGTCYPNPDTKSHLYYNSSTTADYCCAQCALNPACDSWSVWNPTDDQDPSLAADRPGPKPRLYHCRTFKGVGMPEVESGCIGGANGPPTPSPPAQRPYPDRTPQGTPCRDCPNIVFALTDDQDITLGGWEPMKQTQQRIQSRGVLLDEWRIHTPICSPSRSELVSGRYFHNIKSNKALPPPVGTTYGAATAHVNSSHYINASFGVYLREQRGYNVALFGKSNFNTFQGFDRWFEGAFVGYGSSWRDDESPEGIYHASSSEYATSLLANRTIEWLSRDNITGETSAGRPFFVYFAPHCPHTPATPPDWYMDACSSTKAPRQPNYNWSTPLFHDVVAQQPALTVGSTQTELH